MLDNLHHLDELVLHLVGTTEDMGIILSEAAHTGQSVQLATLLIAIHSTELCAAERQLFV